MRVALILNPLTADNPHEIDRLNADRRQQVTELIAETLLTAGHEVMHLDVTPDLSILIKRLRDNRPEAVFYQSVRTDPAQPLGTVPALLERLRLPYTGSAPAVCRAAQDKRITKQLLTAAGLRTPKFVVLKYSQKANIRNLPPYPLFVKPLMGGCSIGIPDRNPVHSEPELRAALKAVNHESRQPALVETYLGGREFTVGILGNQPPSVLPVMEYLFKEGVEGFRSFSGKTSSGQYEIQVCPAVLTEEEKNVLECMALEVYRVIGCRDYARVDVRCDRHSLPYVLEVNAHPSLLPSSSLPRMAAVAGYSYQSLLETILKAALARYGIANAGRSESAGNALAI